MARLLGGIEQVLAAGGGAERPTRQQRLRQKCGLGLGLGLGYADPNNNLTLTIT